MIDERKIAFDNISKVLAVTRYDIEQRQLIGDYGLNIHAENFFRDIFNFVYPLNLENANFTRDINNLDTAKLIELNRKYFLNIEEYTDIATLDLVFKHIVQHKKKRTKTNYNNDDFGSLDANEKLKLNSINERISAAIKQGLDWASILEKLEEDGTITKLKDFVIDDLYMGILHEFLKTKAHKEELKNKKLLELHELAVKHQLSLNDIIGELCNTLEACIDIRDFNSTSVSWVIIAYFFEICDVGVKK